MPYTLYGDVVKLTRLAKAAQDALVKAIAACTGMTTCTGFAPFISDLESVVSRQAVNTVAIQKAVGVTPEDGSLGGSTGTTSKPITGYLLNSGGIKECKASGDMGWRCKWDAARMPSLAALLPCPTQALTPPCRSTPSPPTICHTGLLPVSAGQ